MVGQRESIGARCRWRWPAPRATPWRSRRRPTSRRGRRAGRPPPRRRGPRAPQRRRRRLHSRTRPSAISMWSDPATWYWKCGASQRSVPAMCLTWLDQRQPGSRVRRPMSLPATWTNSTRPRSKVRVSSGVANVFCSAVAMAVDPPVPCAPGGPACLPIVHGAGCRPMPRQWQSPGKVAGPQCPRCRDSRGGQDGDCADRTRSDDRGRDRQVPRARSRPAACPRSTS